MAVDELRPAEVRRAPSTDASDRVPLRLVEQRGGDAASELIVARQNTGSAALENKT